MALKAGNQSVVTLLHPFCPLMVSVLSELLGGALIFVSKERFDFQWIATSCVKSVLVAYKCSFLLIFPIFLAL